MSIPGKVLIALITSLIVSAVTASLVEGHSLTHILVPTALASLAAVILSHRALPMPGSLAGTANSNTPPARKAATPDASSKTQKRSEREQKAKPSRKKTRSDSSEHVTPPATQPQSNASGQENGTVKWFNGSKGFGFIIRDNGEEIFVHHRSIVGEGRRTLRDGAAVRFRVVTTDKGPQAEDVEASE